MKRISIKVAIIGIFATMVASCNFERSSVTGWDYNNPRNGGYEKKPYDEQETGPGLILIEGGTFTMGQVEQDVMYEHHNTPRRVTISSFYLDQTEVTNHHWCEYLYWIDRTFAQSFAQIHKKALPDTLVWRSKLAYNEPKVDYYLRHPSYRDYPVVGVSWLQANDFCSWRTDRVNEYILIREGILITNPMQQDEPFTTDSYLIGKYDLGLNELGQMPDKDPSRGGYDALTGKFKSKNQATRNVRMEDGILLPRYRLPTEAEWEFASYGLIGNTVDERIVERRIYPWNGHWVRNPDDKWQGDMMANFVRGAGDYMGVAGHLNDNADVTAPVISYWPNDYGLYNMAGNVSEWVMDVYRPNSSEDFDEFNPFRGNKFTTKTLKSDGTYADKYDEVIYDLDGMQQYIREFKMERYEEFDRTYGYVKRDRMDAIEIQLLNEIDTILTFAQKQKSRKQEVESSRTVRLIFDDLLLDFNDRVQAQDLDSIDWGGDGFEWDEYEVEIIPMVRIGLGEFAVNTPGNVKSREVTSEENMKRRNYKVADNIDYLDGDLKSSIYYPGQDAGVNKQYLEQMQGDELNEDWAMYQSGKEQKLGGKYSTTLVSDKSRVYKGGSWKDRAYWMNPGTRRFLDEDLSTATIGFRCAMDRIGSPTGLGSSRR
ncbi:MAG: gliding motility-associated lipoprotein GldJ [Parvicella sp.]|jgi:gliding motility-associated lipoprotein GldJ